MDKTFDELFNDFFKRPSIKDNEFFKKIREEAKKMIKSMSKFEDISNKTEEEMEELLGEPDEIETTFDGVFYYEKKIWHTENGDIVVVSASKEPFVYDKKEKTLEEQLEEAISIEDYEKAAEIRDKIKSLEKPIKKSRKKSS